MKLWFDEDLTPTLVQVAHEQGFAATCNRDRDMLGRPDHEVRRAVQSEEYVLVTDNASDFRPMYARAEVHHGLIAIPGTVPREHQQELARAVLAYIVEQASTAGEVTSDFMVNKLVEIDDRGDCSTRDLPPR